jgi:hypothetical protein
MKLLRHLTNIEILAVEACRLAYAELNQWHRGYHPDCPGGCPTAEAMDACRAVLDAVSPAKAPEAASAPVASPDHQTPRAEPGASEAGAPLRLPPEPKGLIKFQVRDGANRVKILGYVWAANATHAAEKLGGRLVQSCLGWARVEIPGEAPIELFWKTA